MHWRYEFLMHRMVKWALNEQTAILQIELNAIINGIKAMERIQKSQCGQKEAEQKRA